MILHIKSNNPHLLDLLHRNPATDFGLYAKPLKNGVVIGNAVDAHHYEVVFQDTRYSYLPEESNQIDYQSYCNPLVVLNICTEFFAPLLRSKPVYEAHKIPWLDKTNLEIDNVACTIDIPTFFIRSSWVREGVFLLSRYFAGVRIKHTVGSNYQLQISAKNVFEAMNLLNVVAVFTHLTNNYGVFTYIEEKFAEKYARILTNVSEVPYFIFYLFIKRTVKNEAQFKLVKPVFEEYLQQQGYVADFTYYDTHGDRIRFIEKYIDGTRPLLDVGCGEFIYYKRFRKKGFDLPYYAIDKEEQFAEMGRRLSEKMNTDNLYFYNSITAAQEDSDLEGVDIILTEVIEHNTMEEATALVKELLGLNFNKLIITTPNKDFNQYYFDQEEDKRHDDHHFELSNREFETFMAQFDTGAYKIEHAQIGDRINGTQPTQACIISSLS